MSEHTALQAKQILEHHGFATRELSFIGAGKQSICYGTTDVAVLISRAEGKKGGKGEETPDLTGHVIPDGNSPIFRNDYAALQWLTARAADAGVRTPRILAVGEQPRPHALIQRAQGTLASAHPHLRQQESATDWFAQLGVEVRKTNLIHTTGFGMFTPDGSGGYRGRFPTWADYLNRWLGVHLCVGPSRPQDEKVLNQLLAQGIVTEHDVALVVSKVREAQAWPVRSVLTHYDNRLDNIVVNSDGITVLDWGLSLAGIGIQQELVKLFETEPTSTKSPRVAAFLHSYGLSGAECTEAIEGGKLMLVLDGLAMSYSWVDNPQRLGGVRGWLQTVKQIARSW